MNNILRSVLAVVIGTCALSVQAQTDVTSSYITNAGFDIQSEWATSDQNNNKTVIAPSEWTFSGGSDWYYTATFGIGSGKKLNGGTVPATNSDGVASGGALGLSVGWGNTCSFKSKEVTLTPGTYSITYAAYNVCDATQATNLIGFVESAGTTHYGTKNSFPKNQWTIETISFDVTADTKGYFSIGIKAISGGSGSNAKLFVDYIKITKGVDLTAWNNAKAAADGTLAKYDASYAANERAAVVAKKGSANPTSIADMNILVSELNALVKAYETQALKEECAAVAAKASSSNPVDLTKYFIVNAGVTSTAGWTNARTSSGEQYPTAPDNTYFDGWNNNAVNMTQVLSGLPAGQYVLKCATRAHTDVTNGNIYVMANGKNLAQTNLNHVGNTGGELGNGWGWTVVEFLLDNDGDVKIGFWADCASNKWAGADNFTLTFKGPKVLTAYEKAEIVLTQELNTAKQAINTAIIGTNIFSYSPVSIAKYGNAIEMVENMYTNAKNEVDLFDAIDELREATKRFGVIMPKATEGFLVRHKASGLYLNLDNGVKVVPKTEATEIYLHRTEEGQWYLLNTVPDNQGEYVGYLGTNAWSLTNTLNDKFDISLESVNIYYILGKNGYLGSDDVSKDNNVYGDKAKNTNSQWFFEYYTSEPPTNLAFDEGSFIDNGVCTYAKDITVNNTTYSQMQNVQGWVMGVANGDARAGAQYKWGSPAFLGGVGYTAPATSYDGNTEGGALGIVGVWTGTVQYVQNAELAAGTYTITVPIYNVGGSDAFVKNLIGFIAKDGTEYLATSKSYKVGEWTLEQVTFTLANDTKGVVSVGYVGENKGSAAMPHLFLDYVDIAKGSPKSNESSEEVTAIANSSSVAAPVAIYSANGAKLNALQKGVNIVRMSDNTVRKIIHK